MTQNYFLTFHILISLKGNSGAEPGIGWNRNFLQIRSGTEHTSTAC